MVLGFCEPSFFSLQIHHRITLCRARSRVCLSYLGVTQWRRSAVSSFTRKIVLGRRDQIFHRVNSHGPCGTTRYWLGVSFSLATFVLDLVCLLPRDIHPCIRTVPSLQIGVLPHFSYNAIVSPIFLAIVTLSQRIFSYPQRVIAK